MAVETGEVRVERRGRAGVVTLDRGEALNALTASMIEALDQALDRLLSDDRIAHIVFRSAVPGVFSAGGDIRDLYGRGLAAKRGAGPPPLDFFSHEYRLDHRIGTAEKPVISFLDGVTMGGGAGISINGRFRVAGDRFRFAMPEVGIGFFPDVGATVFLPRLPMGFGRWLGLTGARIGADHAVWSGLATHRVASAAFPALLDRLAESPDTGDVLASFARPVAAPDARPWEDAFSATDLPAIRRCLLARAEAEDPFARTALAGLDTASPTSLLIAARQLGPDAAPDLATALRTEFRIVSRVLEGDDFYEGVRAQIVDKDRRPRWRPARIEDVDREAVDRCFRPLDQELEL